MKPLKLQKGAKESHTAPTKYGMGDYYGTGYTAKIGRLRTGTMLPGNPVKKSKLKNPPKSLA
jgi:hypothetical protein